MWCVTTLAAVLLTATTYQVDSLLPYRTDSSGKCQNHEREYKESVWCCSRCSPGTRLKEKCDETADSVCEPCPSGQYMEGWNYRPHCSSCQTCAKDKGLEYQPTCTKDTRSRCVCQPGMYCIVGFDDRYCTECFKYRLCKPGFGVSRNGTAESNVKCSACSEGTFSDKVSYTQPCKPHTRCQKAVVQRGNVTSDTVCEPTTHVYTVTPQSTTETPFTVAYTTTSLLTTSIPMKPDSPLTVTGSPDPVTSNHPITTPPASTVVQLVTIVVPAVIGCVLLIILLVVLWQSKITNRKVVLPSGGQKLDPLTPTNGHCEKIANVHHNYVWATQITSLAVNPHEQHSLMEIQEPCTDLSNGSTKPLAGMENPCGMEHESLV